MLPVGLILRTSKKHATQSYHMTENQNKSKVCSVRYVPKHTPGITGTGHFGKFGTTSIPVPDTSVSSVRHQYRYRALQEVRYIHTGTVHFGKFGTIWMRYGCRYRRYRYRLSYRYRTLWEARYNITTGTGHFGKFGTKSIPLPDTSVCSVRHTYRYRAYRYRTKHTLRILRVLSLSHTNSK